MLGSYSSCLSCGKAELRRNVSNRTTQCTDCRTVLEERCSDLMEYCAWTDTEEVHCVVAPDFLSKDLIDEDIEEDPYCTRGFVTAFRMLSPMRDPAYLATARTFSGDLAEMERLIGDALYGGYVGYNGRQPGMAREGSDSDKKVRVKTEVQGWRNGDIESDGKDEQFSEGKTGSFGNAQGTLSGGDARHTVVAYFQVLELSGLLEIPKEISEFAVRIFRHTASRTSLRNRNVEALATASLVCAVERTRYLPGGAESGPDVKPSDIAKVAGLTEKEVARYLKLVNTAMQRQRPETSASIAVHMPSFCRRLGLPESVQLCAVGIAEKVLKKNICSRRNPMSISAAAIYLACQLEDKKKTQQEICKVTRLTEVTLRKVNKELARNINDIIPDGYQPKVDPLKTVPNSVKSEATQCELFRDGPTRPVDRLDAFRVSGTWGREGDGHGKSSTAKKLAKSARGPPIVGEGPSKQQTHGAPGLHAGDSDASGENPSAHSSQNVGAGSAPSENPARAGTDSLSAKHRTGRTQDSGVGSAVTSNNAEAKQSQADVVSAASSAEGTASGLSAMPGSQGMAVMSGMQGMQGMPGMPGMSGMPGMPGMPGAAAAMQNMAGMQMMHGMQGMPGMQGMGAMPGMGPMAGMPGISGMPGMPQASGQQSKAQGGGTEQQASFAYFGFPPMFTPFFMPPPPLPPPLPNVSSDETESSKKNAAPAETSSKSTGNTSVPPGYPAGMMSPWMFPFAPAGMSFPGFAPTSQQAVQNASQAPQAQTDVPTAGDPKTARNREAVRGSEVNESENPTDHGTGTLEERTESKPAAEES
ncbi:hypothetical protein NDN08_007848 [Rhodosorus marinus]|uniref:Cyclin-like domain-containing protein n=1 Tax=Rhodosorus marinus TaxID=101924 RepID=A0AAV8V2A8_9RHOD|nr:hypothetical protein NDN08_007848 [Rhodosorus marinus]